MGALNHTDEDIQDDVDDKMVQTILRQGRPIYDQEWLDESDRIADIVDHYETSRKNYDVEGESHLEYYRQKHFDNYEKLMEHYGNNKKDK